MSPGGVLRPASLRLGLEEADASGGPGSLKLDDQEARLIREALKRSGGIQAKAAKELGIHRETLINKMRRYGIRSEHDQGMEEEAS